MLLEYTYLCAIMLLSPQTRVTSKRSASLRRSANEAVTLVWKSFHLRQKESSEDEDPIAVQSNKHDQTNLQGKERVEQKTF